MSRSKQLKLELMDAITDKFAGQTQVSAAKTLGVRQPRACDLFNKKAEKFSLDTLVDLAVRSGISLDHWSVPL